MKKRLFLISTILCMLLCISTSTIYGMQIKDSININPETGDIFVTYLSICILSFAGITVLYKLRKFRKD